MNIRSFKAIICSSFFAIGTPVFGDNYMGFTSVNHNGVEPKIEGKVIRFSIHDRECSQHDYGDGRDEDDCRNGNVTSYMIKAFHAKPKDTFLYHLEVNVDPNIKYMGFANANPKRPAHTFHDSRLRLFAFLRDIPKNHIYELKLDALSGATFMGSFCFVPKDFGRWNSIDMLIHWTADSTGSIEVKCNGKTIYKEINVVTTLSPQCYVTNHCILEEQNLKGKIHFSFGLRMDGFGREWQKYGKNSQFTDIQSDGITVSYRNVSVAKQ